MLPLDPHRPRYAWRVRLWLLPATLIVLLACGLASPAPPPTLWVQPATPTGTPHLPETPTPALPVGAIASYPIDPVVREMLDKVESDRLMVTVASLVDMKTRHVLSKNIKLNGGSTGGIEGARDWIQARFNDIHTANPQRPITVWLQDVPYKWNNFSINTQNVVAVFQGTDVGAGVFVVGAHYDSITTDFANGEAFAPGANDNGSGIAAMLEIARLMAARPHRATIIFVAFAAEETGRQGSQAFVKSYLQAQSVDLRGMINLDIIGSDTGPNGEIDRRTLRLFSADPNDSPSRQLARQVALVTRLYFDDVDPVVQSSEDRTGRWGDHQSFRAAGYPAVRVIQGLEDTTRQHSPRDTLDNVQPAYLLKTTRVTLASVALLADGPEPPKKIALQDLRNAAQPGEKALTWSAVAGASQYIVTLRQTSSLYFDQVFTMKASDTPQLVWSGLDRYNYASVASVDANGRMGSLAPEVELRPR